MTRLPPAGEGSIPRANARAALADALAERDHYRDEFLRLRGWLMHLVGSASTLNSAKRVVERAIADAIERNRRA